MMGYFDFIGHFNLIWDVGYEHVILLLKTVNIISYKI